MKNANHDVFEPRTDERDARNRATGKQLCKQLLRNQEPVDAFRTLTTALLGISQCDDFLSGDDAAISARAEAVKQLDELFDLLTAAVVARDCVH